jgi:exportin-5
MSQETIMFTTELFQRVITAVLCSFNPTTTNNDKQYALNFLEDLKENHPLICLTIGFELLKQQTNNESLLHHYGIHLIESIIKHKWNLLKQDEKTLVKEQLFILIKSSCLNPTFMEPIYIRNSLARCLVEMIKRDCFEKVNTTLDEIVLMTQGFAQIEGLFYELIVNLTFFKFR